MEVSLGTVRKAAEISYLSGPRWTSLPVLVLVTGGGMEYILYHLWISRGPRDRPSAAEKKERLSRQPATSKMMPVFWISLFRVSTLVPDGTF